MSSWYDTGMAYDKANQLVTSTAPDGKVTKYTYDAAGRMVKEGAKSYRYGYLDKVMSVTEGKNRITYGYHVDGQLATVTKGKVTEEFTWDGLALVKRGTTSYVNEPHPGGGAPVASSDGGVMFNDILGTTLGLDCADGYSPVAKTAFGDAETADDSTFFTGKPHVDGLGHAFLLRNYRADLGKWPTADPLGYPDGWNQMAYCRNMMLSHVDFIGGENVKIVDPISINPGKALSYGILTIHTTSVGEGSSFNLSGHSWLEFEEIGTGIITTYGTWGNNPTGSGNGLFTNIEKNNGLKSIASRSTYITEEQAKTFLNEMEKYKNMGEDAWSITDPCSDFAARAWETVTGKDLGSFWPWDTPSDLMEAIKRANNGKMRGWKGE